MKNLNQTCTFTGHRPERLELPEKQVIQWLDEQIRQAINDGYTEFITGMQRGVDIWAAEAFLKLRKEGKPIRLISAVAFREMENRWESSWQERYRNIISASDEVHYICDKPGKKAFFARNQWMVDHAHRLIAVYTGAPGGTKGTIEYARKLKREVVQIKN